VLVGLPPVTTSLDTNAAARPDPRFPATRSRPQRLGLDDYGGAFPHRYYFMLHARAQHLQI
jgi:hypothetical protein